MREIKFRAFEGGKMHEVSAIYPLQAPSESGKIVCRVYDNISDQICFADALMQFTGLKDKNGKEFYTKDIFDIGQTVNGQSIFVLMECIGGFDVRYAHDLNRKYEYDVNDLFRPAKYEGVVEFEIIGNIYEHPELVTPK